MFVVVLADVGGVLNDGDVLLHARVPAKTKGSIEDKDHIPSDKKRACSPQPLEGGLGLVDEPPVGLLALVRAVVVKVESLQVLHDLVGVDGLAPVVHDHLRMFPDGEKDFFQKF